MTWQNWSRNVSCTPERTVEIATTDQAATVVAEAAERGQRVKAVGAGHSFSPIAEAPGVQLDLDRCRGLLAVDEQAKQVTLAAGTRLHQLPALFEPYGLAMANLGDIDRQSVAGAVSTGTHGTGLRFGGLATQVVGLTLVDGTGEVHRLDGDRVASSVVGLGALGVVTEVTLQLVDRFLLDAREHPEPLTEVLDHWNELIGAHDHLEFFWFPHTDTALVKSQTRLSTDAERRPLRGWKRWLDDDLIANGVFELTCRLGHRRSALVPTINRLADRLTGNRAFCDWSTSVLTTQRKVRFQEMEYALPVDALPEAVRRLRELIERRDWRIGFPLECRVAAADDRWLSTAYQRTSAYVAVHRYWRDDPSDYFAAAEEILVELGGRPHWGKMHTRTAAELAEVYPRFADFLALRDRLDPQRVFANPYLEQVLG